MALPDRVVTQWTFRLPPLGEMDGAWMYKSDNPSCPIESFTLKQSLVPLMPAEVVMTLTIIPADPPKTGEMEIAPKLTMDAHTVQRREVPVNQVARGPQADAYEVRAFSRAECVAPSVLPRIRGRTDSRSRPAVPAGKATSQRVR